jgi:hypothetical protein
MSFYVYAGLKKSLSECLFGTIFDRGSPSSALQLDKSPLHGRIQKFFIALMKREDPVSIDINRNGKEK